MLYTELQEYPLSTFSVENKENTLKSVLMNLECPSSDLISYMLSTDKDFNEPNRRENHSIFFFVNNTKTIDFNEHMLLTCNFNNKSLLVLIGALVLMKNDFLKVNG